jgi:AraC family transcriptional regulator
MLEVDELQDTSVAIERVIAAMRLPNPEVRTLSEMAELACLSRFHFCRVFHRAAGIPPAAFFSALRLDQAKRLLLSTDSSVTETCYGLGYSSLGAFTTRFSHHVGVSPGRFRRLLETTHEALVALERDGARPQFWPDVVPAISGHVVDATGAGGPTFVGLFPVAVAQGRPVAGTALARPGPYSLPLPPAGRYALLAVSLPQHCDAVSALAPDTSSLVGSAATPIVVRGNSVYGSTAIRLRRFLPTDPPVLVALPPLLLRRETGLAATTGGRNRNFEEVLSLNIP